MTVDVKSSAESTKEANTERDEEVRVTMILAMRSKMLAAKLTLMARFTIRELVSLWASEWEGRRADSSSNETLREEGAEKRDGRW